MELTREYFDQQINKLVTKDDLEKKLNAQTKELKAFAEEQAEALARIIAKTVAVPMERHFTELKNEKQLRKDVENLKADMRRIKEALHLSSA